MVSTASSSQHQIHPRRWLMAAAVASSLASVHGYSVGAPVSMPRSTVFPLGGIELSILAPEDSLLFDLSTGLVTPSNQQQRKPLFGATFTKPAKTTYDLGLGKNAPVSQSSGSDRKPFRAQRDHIDVFQATKYWTEYESAREFPSPQSQMTVVYEKTSLPLATTKKTRKTVALHPKRSMQDSLTIVEATRNDQAVMVPSDPSSQRDVNSVWVEMLIHYEQQKQNAVHMNVN
ncbi:expressed unknown protein [Seminavis robusta]|uniref:Uncharacterized protein n=1 Tax=Seminavis robusta TaxID=568900 RepID=A0A9N8DCK6_9STRA|nr:expressed unknown protein [Seminavis robusta]|eukprot:Sro90_g047480.1 n/a (231) ;mRNA; f:110397-111089